MNAYTAKMGRWIAVVLLCAIALAAASCAKPSRTEIAMGLVDSMQKGDFAAAAKHFDSTMAAQMPADKLKELWTALNQQAGALKSRTVAQETKEQGFDTVFVTCEFAKMKLDLKVVFDSDQKVSGLWVVPSQRLPEAKY